jgi:hypothetical protein
MEGSTGAPPQRVCPNCARISWATGPRCPYCQERFRRHTGVTPWMLALTAAIVLIVVALMFVFAGNVLEDRVDDRIAEVNKEFDASLDKFRADMIKELDARQAALGATSTGIPTPTPVPTAAPPVEGDGSTAPTPTPTSSPSAEATPTETPHTEIRP